MVQSALSQQISRLESNSRPGCCSAQRGSHPHRGRPGLFPQAQLTLRHAQQAIRAAQQARLSGAVSMGLSPTIANVLGLPLMRAMRERYPDVRCTWCQPSPGI
jgi:LysR family tcuABC transcriptional regulator